MNTLNNSNILKNALVGVEFEFYSDIKIDKVAKELSSLLNKKIRVEEVAHSDFEVTSDEWKLEPDMSGGAALMELVTGPIPYFEARIMIIRVSKWIETNGWTSDRGAIHLNLSFDVKKIGQTDRIKTMNVLKFILDFKEDQIFKFFPKRDGSAYSKSIKDVLPIQDTYFFDGKNIIGHNFTHPTTKYYGVNFIKRFSNYLEFRYLGGKDWEKKTDKVLHLLDSFLMQLWNSTESKQFTEENAMELKKILSKNRRIIKSKADWRHIEKNWKNVKFTVDLMSDAVFIDSHWGNVKENVIALFHNGGLLKGHINYDTDTGKVQVRGGVLEYCSNLIGYEFIDCNISGEFTDCDLYGCDINNAILDRCNLYSNTQVNSSKIATSYVSNSVKLKDSFIHGKGIMKGEMTDSIFREGSYDKKLARFNNTEIVTSNQI